MLTKSHLADGQSFALCSARCCLAAPSFTSSPLSQRPLSPAANSESGSESSTSAINIPNARRPVQLASIESASMLAPDGNAFVRDHDLLTGPSRLTSTVPYTSRSDRRTASSMLHNDTALSSSSEDEEDLARETTDSFDANASGSFVTSHLSRSLGRSRPNASPRSFSGVSAVSATSPPFLREGTGRRKSSGSWASNRRLSANAMNTTPPASPSMFSSSFVGSFEASLLSGRMANRPSNAAALPFSAQLGVLGLGKDTPRGLKCPDHVNLAFGAYFWDMDSRDRQGKGSPYVGNLNLEDHYFEQLNRSDAAAVPKFPGYRIPPKGQIQLVIKNANETAVKLFLVPYDLSDMPAGSKTFLRQKSYDIASEKSRLSTSTSNHKDTLRYAIHLQICSPPLKTKERGRRRLPAARKRGGTHSQHNSLSPVKDMRNRSPTKADHHVRPSRQKAEPAPYLYLHQAIRIVFTSRALDMSEKLRSVLENPNGPCDKDGMSLSSDQTQAPSTDRISLYMPYKGPGDEWESARKARLLQDKALELRSRLEDPVPSDPNAASFSSGMTMLDALKHDDQALLNTPPSIGSQSGLGIALAKPPSTADTKLGPALIFGRNDASRFAPLPALVESGLSISRPGSRNSSSSRNSDPLSPEHRTFGILPDGCLR